MRLVCGATKTPLLSCSLFALQDKQAEAPGWLHPTPTLRWTAWFRNNLGQDLGTASPSSHPPSHESCSPVSHVQFVLSLQHPLLSTGTEPAQPYCTPVQPSRILPQPSPANSGQPDWSSDGPPGQMPHANLLLFLYSTWTGGQPVISDPLDLFPGATLQRHAMLSRWKCDTQHTATLSRQLTQG